MKKLAAKINKGSCNVSHELLAHIAAYIDEHHIPERARACMSDEILVCTLRASMPLSVNWKERIDEDVKKRGR